MAARRRVRLRRIQTQYSGRESAIKYLIVVVSAVVVAVLVTLVLRGV